MPRPGREQQEQERRTNAERWAAWLNPALKEVGWNASDLAAASNGRISRQVASKWMNADHAPVAKLAILTARLVRRNVVEALRAAGHGEIADFAEESRTDPAGALIKHALDELPRHSWLAWLDDEHERGIIPDDEYERVRADFLRREEESIRLMRADYEAAVRRKHAEQPEPNGNRAAQ